ncbi:MAG: hypothetical protein ABGX83_05260 [Nitrospira sp.]
MENKQEAALPQMQGQQQIQGSSDDKYELDLVVCSSLKDLKQPWKIISPYVKELADQSMGEYSPSDVAHALLYGVAVLYMGWIKGDPRKFVGFMILRYEPRSVHVWQAYILPEFRGTDAFDIGAKHLIEEIEAFDYRYITFSATKDIARRIAGMGFQPTFQIWRKDLKPNGR